jgi:hypothetical protein
MGCPAVLEISKRDLLIEPIEFVQEFLIRVIVRVAARNTPSSEFTL